MTGYARSEEAQQLLDAGADGLVTKPVSLAELTREVARALQGCATSAA